MNTFIEVPASKKSLANRVLVHGVGINDSTYNTIFNGARCPYYERWRSMLLRCYSAKNQEKQPTYTNCYVCGEWLTFSNFRKWMTTQDWNGKQLDKDLINPGNKLYSPDSCVFVPLSLNALLTDHAAGRGKYPQGVCLKKDSGRFQARCNVYGKLVHIGYFDTPSEASEAYKKFKSNHIKEVAQQYKSNERLYNGLMSHAKAIVENAALK